MDGSKDIPSAKEIEEALEMSSDIDESITSLDAGVARRHSYVGELFDRLRRERLEKMRDLGVRRADTDPEASFIYQAVQGAAMSFD